MWLIFQSAVCVYAKRLFGGLLILKTTVPRIINNAMILTY